MKEEGKHLCSIHDFDIQIFVVCVYIFLLKYLFIIRTSFIQQHIFKPLYKTRSEKFIGKTIIDLSSYRSLCWYIIGFHGTLDSHSTHESADIIYNTHKYVTHRYFTNIYTCGYSFVCFAIHLDAYIYARILWAYYFPHRLFDGCD